MEVFFDKAKKLKIFITYFRILTDESLQISNCLAISGSNVRFNQLDPLSHG